MSITRGLGLFAVAFILGLLFFTEGLNFSSSQNSKSLGETEKVSGTVLIRTPSDPTYLNLTEKAALPAGTHIISGAESFAQLVFGVPFRLTDNSAIRLTEKKGRLEVHLLSGRLEIKQPGVGPTRFFVDGEARTGAVIQATEKPQLTSLGEMPSGKLTEFNKKDRKLLRKLKQTFKLHQRFMEKCFIKHYERTKGQTQAGLLNFRFILTPKGRLKDVNLQKSDYSDEDFHDCMAEVVSRVQVKYYDGEKREVDFPVQVYLPR